MDAPWLDGPKELIQHAVDHLDLGGDFDKRIAMISIDNAVELIIKTHLGLPERARDSKGPGRRELAEASESFPMLLDLLQKYSVNRISGFSLDDIEWYHRVRNQLYHSGDGITVELSKVETYLALAITLFKSLFGTSPALRRGSALHTKTGQFLQLWNAFDDELHQKLPPKDVPAYYWKRDYLASISPEAALLWESLVAFRNQLVFGLSEPNIKLLQAKIDELNKLLAITKIHID